MRTFIAILIVVWVGGLSSAEAQRRRANEPDPDAIRNIEYLLGEAEKHFLTEDYAQALNAFLKVLDEDPSNPAANYKVAQIYAQEEDYQKALVYARAAVEASPQNKYLQEQLADIYGRQADYAQAAKVYENLLKLEPGGERYYYELAALYLYQREVDKALATYDRLQVRFGMDPDVSYQKQKILISQGKLDAAIKEAEALIASDPTDSRHVYSLVDLLINQGETAQAIPYLEKALIDFPENNRTHLVLADLNRREGDYERGLYHLQLAASDPELELDDKLRLFTAYILQLPNEQLEAPLQQVSDVLVATHPEEPQSYNIYGDLLFQLGDKPGAREKYLKGVALDGSNFEVWQNIVAIDWEEQAYGLVIEHTEEALTLFPNQAVLYYYNGHAYYLKKDYTKATRAMEQGKRLAYGNQELQKVFLGLLGDAYNAQKDYQKSDRAYEDALKLDADNVFVLNNYSYFLSLRREKLNRARELSARLVQLEPQNSTYLDTHGWVLYQLSEYQSAADYLKRAINQGSPNGTILEHYGDVLFRLNRVDEALQQWKRAQEAGGHSDLLDQKISDRQLYENP